MATASEKTSPTTPFLSSDRIWAEQLAAGLVIFLGLLIFMAFYHAPLLASGAKVLTTGDLAAYGWYSVAGVVFLLIVHEIGTIAVARFCRLPLKFRLFPFGVNAAAILDKQPRRVWTDALVGLAGPVLGTLVSFGFAGIYEINGNPFFLGMACVGYFYNLFTLIPILELEGGWIAPAIAPQAWFVGLVAAAFLLTQSFNLFLLAVLAFGIPRLILVILRRAPQEDLTGSGRQRIAVAVVYFALVLALAYLGTTTYDSLSHLVPEAMGD